MNQTLSNRTIALAGTVQASALVDQLARNGECNPDTLRYSLATIPRIDADTVEDVYGGLEYVNLGLRNLRDHFGAMGGKPNAYIPRYTISLLVLQRKLAKDGERSQQLGNKLQQLQQHCDHLSADDANVIQSMAEVYRDVISEMTPRIIVHGEPQHLQSETVVRQIRACLLAGLRSAVLWQQCGGSRLELLFGRNRLVKEAGNLLRHNLG